MDALIDASRTAIGRSSLSRPLFLALADGLLPLGTTIFDYGCGRGGDIQHLTELGYEVGGWDPAHRPQEERRPADVVQLGYVVNVIENPVERVETLRDAWGLAQSVLVVAARLDWEARSLCGRPYGDGILTGKGTFQRFYTQEELRGWIEASLGVRSVAAAPGIFYIFRDEGRAQALLAARVRYRPAPRVRRNVPRRLRVSEVVFETNRGVLDPLVAFVEARGRLPAPFEIAEASEIERRFGTIKSALAVVRRVAGNESWQAAQERATEDLMIYLALAAFGGRPKFTMLPEDLQLDVRAFFGSYKDACATADTLLFEAGDQAAVDRACRQSEFGKLTPEALYVHSSSIGTLGALLRVYEGCARILTGTVEGTTIVKLNRVEPKVAYLAYPDFDRDPHPALATSVRADLRRLHVKFRDFRNSDNPPILHRKETFVDAEYPGRVKFARLTAKEERLGLYSDPSAIGTRDRWDALVADAGLQFRGHQLVRRVRVPAAAP